MDLGFLGNSFNTGKNSFLNLENKFNAKSQFKEAYINFMNEYLKLGHMTLTIYRITGFSKAIA